MVNVFENTSDIEEVVWDKTSNYLFNGDCLEIMKYIPNGSIDMILCDLPYGTTRNKWDVIIPLNKLWEYYNRIIKDNGAIVLFAQTPFDKILGCSNLKSLRYEWIWKKNNATGFLNAKKMPLKIHENILVFYKKLPIYNPQMRGVLNLINASKVDILQIMVTTQKITLLNQMVIDIP